MSGIVRFSFSAYRAGTLYCIQGLKTAIVEGHDIGGTCVNRGCVPSKALLAASGRVRDLKNDMHLKSLGIQVSLCNQFVTFALAQQIWKSYVQGIVEQKVLLWVTM